VILPEWLRHRARLTPNRLALLCGVERYTFAELDRAVDATAGALAAAGVRRGDRVALLLRNGVPFVRLVHAAPRLGVELVLLNTRLTAPELQFQLEDSGATLLVHDAPDAELARALPTRRLDVADLAEHSSLDSRVEAIDLTATQSIIYTSGTTGRPKGAILTYGNHWWSAVGSALNLGHREDDRWLAVLPLFHVGGLAILLRSVVYGICAEVHEAFDPARVNAAIDDGATIISVVSAMLARVLDARGERPCPPTLRCMLLGGGPAPRPLLERCAEHGIPVVQTYGLTEAASQVATLAPGDALRKLGSAGKPLMPTDLRIDAGGRPAEADEVGEILVRGPTVTPGYVNRPDATARSLSDGWLRTGDLGYLDTEGYLYVVDRRDDLIISGGENVYPAEVEAALLAHPAVAEAGVAGVPDAAWGQVALAVVALRDGATLEPEALRAFCRTRLASYKVPARVRVVDTLPRNAAGKLLRRDLPGLE
jgi:O-succinylbenzoic acid--CoA ligase